jgi:hypothetical protein
MATAKDIAMEASRVGGALEPEPQIRLTQPALDIDENPVSDEEARYFLDPLGKEPVQVAGITGKLSSFLGRLLSPSDDVFNEAQRKINQRREDLKAGKKPLEDVSKPSIKPSELRKPKATTEQLEQMDPRLADATKRVEEVNKQIDDLRANNMMVPPEVQQQLDDALKELEDAKFITQELAASTQAQGELIENQVQKVNPELSTRAESEKFLQEKAKPVDIGDDGLLSDFRAKGARGDAKIPDRAQLYQNIEAVSKTYRGKIDAATRGKIEMETTRDLADLIGMDENKLKQSLLSREVGGVVQFEGLGLAETVLASRDLLVREMDILDDLAERAVAGTPEDALVFRTQLELVGKMQSELKGTQTEIARALNQFKIPAREGEARDLSAEDITDLLRNYGGVDDIQEIADKYLKLDKRSARAKFTRDVPLGAKIYDAANEVFINSILSGPYTLVKNQVGMFITTFAHIPETYVAAGISSVRRGLGMQEGGYRFGEANAQVFGMMMAMREAFSAAATAAKTGERAIPGTKLDPSISMTGRPAYAFSAEAFGAKGIFGHTIDALGTVLTLGRFPTKALEFQDMFGKVVGARQYLYSEAYRTGIDQGLRGDALSTHIAEYITNPPKDAIKDSEKHARYIALQKDLGEMSQGFMKMRRSKVGRALLIPFHVPFVKTLVNATSYAFVDRSPLGMALGEYRSTLKKAKDDPTPRNIANADMSRARMALGSSMGLIAFNYAMEGRITGAGPQDRDLRAAWERTGWRPFSIRIGNEYYSYEAFEPFASILGTVATLQEAYSTGNMDYNAFEKGSLALAVALKSQVSDKTFTQGLANIFAAIDRPETAPRIFEDLVTGFVPSAVRQVEREVDPTLREAKGIAESIKSNIPGLSDSLPPRRDIWGLARVGDEVLAPLTPVWRSTYGPNKLAKDKQYAEKAFEYDKLFVEFNYGPTEGPETFSKDIGFTPRELSRYKQYSGIRIMENMDKITADRTFNKVLSAAREGDTMAHDKVVQTFQSAVISARKRAKQDMLDDPDFGAQLKSVIEEYNEVMKDQSDKFRAKIR